MSESQLDNLLLAWQEEQWKGRDVPAAELCRDCPELANELGRRIDVLRRIDDLMHQSGGPSPSGATVALAAENSRTEMPASIGAESQPKTVRCFANNEDSGQVDPRAATLRADDALADIGSAAARSPAGYEIIAELGRGGMGVVYQARQIKLRRIVALKMILAGSHAQRGELERFRTEAEAIARLQHPHIVQIHEVGEHEGLPFLSLEFCGAGSLEKKLAGTPQSPDIAATLLEKVARAVQAAHDSGVIHRDLKPSNILLVSSGALGGSDDTTDHPPLTTYEPKITDFGLAKKLDEAGQTQTGSIMGTPSYMAPEQAAGLSKNLGPACDIYALGAILYEMLTGRPPFKAATPMDTLLQVMREEPVSPRRLQPKLPQDLETICLKCLRKEPEKRYPSALELAEDLERFRKGEPVRARATGPVERAWRWCRRNPAVAASLLAVVLALLAGTVVSAIFGFHAEEARAAEAEHAYQAEIAKQEADQARRHVQQQLLELCGASGLAAAREGDHALALLWFARAVQFAKDSPGEEELNRIRIANWLRQVCLPEGTFAVPGFRQNLDRFRTFQFSPDGNYLAVVASTGDCLVWNRRQGKLVSLPEAAAKSTAAAWKPRSNLLAVADQAGMIRFLATPEFRVTDEVAASGRIAALAFSRDGRRLAWGSSDGARVWEPEKKRYLTQLLPHGAPVVALSFGAKGDLLASASRDGKARVFRVPSESSKPLFPPVPHAGENGLYSHTGYDVSCPRFAANDQVLLTVERNQAGGCGLKWRSATTGTPHPSNIEGLIFAVSEQGDRVAALCETRGRLIDAWQRETLTPIPAPAPGKWLEHVIFSADGKLLATCGHDTRARFWSLEDLGEGLAEAHPAVYHPNQAVRLSLSASGRHLATALWDGNVCLWRMPAGPPIAYLAYAGGATAPVLSPDAKFVIPRGISYRGGTQLRTRVYDAQTGQPAGPILDPGGILLSAAFSPDGTLVATASSTGRNYAERNSRLFLPDGKSGSVQIWDWKTGKRVAGPVPMPGEPRGLTFRPDGSSIAVVCADYYVMLVDPKTGKIIRRLDPGVRSRPNNANQWLANGNARFTPDGRFLVTWEMGPQVHVWDPDAGKLLHTLPHTERVFQLAFHPTAPDLLATSGSGSNGRVWNLTTGKLVAVLKHPEWVGRQSFSPDGKELLTGCSDGLLRSWDWQAGKVQDGWPLCPDEREFHLTSDRRWLVSAGLRELMVSDWSRKLPVSPRWKTRPHSVLGIRIPLGDRQAIVGGFSPWLVGYDLETMVTPTAEPLDNLAPLAELAAGRRILNQGSIVPLNSAEWLERWDALRQKGTDFFKRAADDEEDQVWFDGTLIGHRAIAEYRKLVSDWPADRALLLKLAAAYEAVGGTREAVPHLAKASAADPMDTLLSMRVAALQAWFGQEKEYAAARQRILAFAKGTSDAVTAERAARACSILPSRNKAELEAALTIARTAVKADKRWDWNLLALGMAEYRSGNFAAAEEALRAAVKAGRGPSAAGIAAFYLPMSLFQQGKKDEARQLANAAAAKMKPLPTDEQNPLVGADIYAHDDLILWLAYKEAKAMIRFDAVSPL